MGIKTFIIDENTMDKDMEENQKVMLETLGRNEGVAFVVRKMLYPIRIKRNTRIVFRLSVKKH